MEKNFRFNLIGEEQKASKFDSLLELKNTRLKSKMSKTILGGGGPQYQQYCRFGNGYAQFGSGGGTPVLTNT